MSALFVLRVPQSGRFTRTTGFSNGQIVFAKPRSGQIENVYLPHSLELGANGKVLRNWKVTRTLRLK